MEKVLGTDVDAVIADIHTPMLRYTNARYGCNLTVNDIRCYQLEEAWHCSADEAKRRVFEFTKTPEFRAVVPVRSAVEVLTRLAKRYKVLAVSSRPSELYELTTEWINKCFPGVYSGVFLTGEYSFGGSKLRKADICRRKGVGVIVDDSFEEIVHCAQQGIRGLLFNLNGEERYGWNLDGELPEGAERVWGWEMAERSITGILE
jgi:5'(3')-deoxyribonucleotidase